MCVICIKPAGECMPGIAKIRRAFAKNKDGAGYMFPYNGEVYIRKGFFNVKDFVSDINKTMKEFNINIKEIPVIIHCRITTSGGTRKENCHPFPLTDDLYELKKTNTTARVGIAHNGVIKALYNSDISDTMWFIKDCLSGLTFDQIKVPAVQNLIKEVVTSDRLVFLNSEGEYVTIGNWVKDGPYLWSNSSFKAEPQYKYAKSSKYLGYSGGTYNSYTDYVKNKNNIVNINKNRGFKNFNGLIATAKCDLCESTGVLVGNFGGWLVCEECFKEDFDSDPSEVLSRVGMFDISFNKERY